MTGCASNVTLDPVTIPTPLIEPMPLSVAIRIPAEFEHYVHEDEVLGREKWRIDLGRPGHRMETDAAKLFTATMAKEVADRAIQVLGGNGYVGEYAVERMWRAAKLLEIGGGTVEAHHKNIVRDLARQPRFYR